MKTAILTLALVAALSGVALADGGCGGYYGGSYSGGGYSGGGYYGGYDPVPRHAYGSGYYSSYGSSYGSGYGYGSGFGSGFGFGYSHHHHR